MENQIANAGTILQAVCHSASVDAGWWHTCAGTVDNRVELQTRSRFGLALAAEKLCLIHSEVSEAMEGLRKNLPDDKLPHRSMFEVELADAAIRIFDLAGAMGFDLGTAIAEKMEFNARRPDHKPEARAAEGGKAF
jgi:NTP pyrophosphatase (non-canonical NTP hydrolase)